uniref:Carboxypeptidase M14A n=1 Tax=Onygena corvina TaxID=180788 RepID=A0A0B4VL11_9EURO|nr:carboxypeptidase A4 [Onygena corvina]
MHSILVLATLVGSALSGAIPSQSANYHGYKVMRLSGEDPSKISDIVSKLGLETWKFPKAANANVDIVVPPKKIADFEKMSHAAGLKKQIMHEDLGKSISSEMQFKPYSFALPVGDADDSWFQSYHSYDDHVKFMNDFQAAHADNAEIVTSGQSHEGRDITGVHVWGSGGKGSKPAIVFHGTTHAREWITTMTVEYMLNQLFEDQEAGAALREKYDFYIFPVANPDGFVYTNDNDRMWRKNRELNQGDCYGTDLNRNWPYQWDGDGSTTDPCTETYRGPSAGSAPETKASTSFLKGLADGPGLKMFIDWHSYSQLFMTPYGYSCSARAPNDDALQDMASSFAQAVQGVHGTSFKTGPICSTIYQANGNSVDWIVDVAKGETAFAAELRDTGMYGFVLPPDQIIPSGEETWAGMKAVFSKL